MMEGRRDSLGLEDFLFHHVLSFVSEFSALIKIQFVSKQWYACVWHAQTHLDLHHYRICNSINDTSLAIILRRCGMGSEKGTRLFSLDVRECDISDRSLPLIASIESLRVLYINGCKKITPRAFFSADTEFLNRLRSISFASSFLDVAVMTSVPSNLTRLHLYRENQASVQSLVSRLPSLRSLRLWLCSMNSLEFLAEGPVGSDSGFELQVLDLFGVIKGDMKEEQRKKMLEPLSALTTLRTLQMHECSLKDDELRYLSSLPLLHTLSIKKNNITGSGLTHLKAMKELRVLDVSQNGLTPEGFEFGMKELEQVRVLDMSFVDSKGFSGRELGGLPPNLKSLTALENRHMISDTSIPILTRRCPSLQYLNLNQNSLTPAVFAPLAELKELRELSLQYIEGLEKGKEGLMQLKGLRKLERVLLPQGETLQYQSLIRTLRPAEAPPPPPTLYDLRMKGNSLMKEGRWKEAAPIYKICTEMAPTDTNVWFFYANICYEIWLSQQQPRQQRQYKLTPEGEEAIRAYKKAVWAWEGHHWAMVKLYDMCHQLGEGWVDDCVHYAKLYMDTHANKDPTLPEWLHAACRAIDALYSSNRLDEALPILLEAINTGGHSSPSLLYYLASCLHALHPAERDDEALRYLFRIRDTLYNPTTMEDKKILEDSLSLIASINTSHGRDPMAPPPAEMMRGVVHGGVVFDKGVGCTAHMEVGEGGLLLHNPVRTFETAVANVGVGEGRWYCEVELFSPGLMQIGWMAVDGDYRTNPKFLESRVSPVRGMGVGDDALSWAVDLHRLKAWHLSKGRPFGKTKWKVGDILGLFIDLDVGTFSLTHNNSWPPWVAFYNIASDTPQPQQQQQQIGEKDREKEIHTTTTTTTKNNNGGKGMLLAPAVSLSQGQKVLFNFGMTPFKYDYRRFEAGYLPLEQSDAAEPIAQYDDSTSEDVSCLEWLADEIVLHILQFTDVRSIAAFAVTHRRGSYICREHMLWSSLLRINWERWTHLLSHTPPLPSLHRCTPDAARKLCVRLSGGGMVFGAQQNGGPHNDWRYEGVGVLPSNAALTTLSTTVTPSSHVSGGIWTDGERIIYCVWDKLTAICISTGNVEWSYGEEGNIVKAVDAAKHRILLWHQAAFKLSLISSLDGSLIATHEVDADKKIERNTNVLYVPSTSRFYLAFMYREKTAVMCLNSNTLEQVWIKAVSSSYHQQTTPVLTLYGDVITLGSSRQLVCVDGSTGDIKWTASLASECRSDPVVNRRNGLVVVKEHGHGLSAYDPVLGYQVWRNPHIEGILEHGMCISPIEGNIYVIRSIDEWMRDSVLVLQMDCYDGGTGSFICSTTKKDEGGDDDDGGGGSQSIISVSRFVPPVMDSEGKLYVRGVGKELHVFSTHKEEGYMGLLGTILLSHSHTLHPSILFDRWGRIILYSPTSFPNPSLFILSSSSKQ